MISKQLLLKLSIFVAIVIVVFDSVLFNTVYPGVRKILLVLFLILLVPRILSLRRLNSELICMLISLIVLYSYYILGMGDDKLSIMIKIFFYALLFYFAGNWVGSYNQYKYKDLFINMSFLFYSYIVITGLTKLGTIGNFEDADRNTFSGVLGNNIETGSVILFWPQVFQLLNLGFVNMFVKYKNTLTRILLIAILVAGSIAIFFSTFSAAVGMLLFSVFLYVIFIFYFTFLRGGVGNRNYYSLVLSIILLFSVYFSTQYIFSGVFGNLGGSKDEINQLFDFDASNLSENKIDNITNNRGGLLAVSLQGFLSSPIFGNGSFYYTDFGGGHSFIFDTLSSFGLLGSVPIFLIFIIILSKTFRLIKLTNYNSKEGFFLLSFLISTLTLSISSIINPYLLHSSMDFFIFFCGGYVSGLLDFKSKERNNYITKTK